MRALFVNRLRLVAGLAALLCTLGAGYAEANDVGGLWGVGLEGGVFKLTEGKWDYSNVDQFFGLGLERGLSRHWDVRLGYQYGYVRPGVDQAGADAGWTFDSGSGYYTVMSHPSLWLQYRVLPESRINPKLGLGMGMLSWKVLNKRFEDAGLFPSGDPATGYDHDDNAIELEATDLTLGLEAGIDAFLRDNLALNLGARWHWLPGNEKDNIGFSSLWGPNHVDANTARIDIVMGLTWWFGSRDNDHDGILNEFDVCPDHAEDFDGFNDEDGCPDPDNDGDRIVDAEDTCPDQPEDFDGFQDEDGCPEADNDGDGIIDGEDRCPDEAEDLDGFRDEDGCPDPDNDGDGVLDGQDQCPGTPSGIEVDAQGCPVVAQIQQELILEGVNFLSGSAQLTDESQIVLQDVAASLSAWPDVRIEIRGHTDSTGSAETNRDLSHRRALAVKDALAGLGIDPGRMTAIGYGEDYPLADNGTAEGRRINRRVEIHKLD